MHPAHEELGLASLDAYRTRRAIRGGVGTRIENPIDVTDPAARNAAPYSPSSMTETIIGSNRVRSSLVTTRNSMVSASPRPSPVVTKQIRHGGRPTRRHRGDLVYRIGSSGSIRSASNGRQR